MYPVYKARDLTSATLLAGQLEDAGIRSGIRNDMLQGALGELPVTLLPEVFVWHQEDISPARHLIGEWERALQTPLGEDILCARCDESNPGNFEICWSCGDELSGTPLGS